MRIRPIYCRLFIIGLIYLLNYEYRWIEPITHAGMYYSCISLKKIILIPGLKRLWPGFLPLIVGTYTMVLAGKY